MESTLCTLGKVMDVIGMALHGAAYNYTIVQL